MKKILIFSFLVLFFIASSVYSYVNSVSKDISESVIRLHVIANSNSPADQDLKYKVRDSLINYMNSININSTSKVESLNNILLHIDDFNDVAKKTINDNGFDYNVNVEYGIFNFPTKQYNNIYLPTGSYDALKVNIGSGNGRNWWCVMFPPLCFIDYSSASLTEESINYLSDSLSDEEFNLVSKNSNVSEFKFKIIEIINEYKDKLSH